jgi:hypothetical protein
MTKCKIAQVPSAMLANDAYLWKNSKIVRTVKINGTKKILIYNKINQNQIHISLSNDYLLDYQNVVSYNIF